MKNTAEDTRRIKEYLTNVPMHFVLYLFSPEEVTKQGQIRYAVWPRQWLNRHQGRIKTLFWYILSVFLSMAISRLH